MPRRKPRPQQPSGRLSAQPRPMGDVFGQTEAGPNGEDYVVRTVPGARAVKMYRCPGCDHEIPPGTAHIVAWAKYGGEDDRRHWHTGCWRGRQTRTITRRWS
ncbi:ATP/GTP-binding protein [Nocardia sp. alder85J]|uniref:ATP/GTP-binding protein n=1 Tax=Nocardia sp. alder85J TaxID=2862949 RepID=UPI001CD7A574|nr:ATP/GTP-binding protein [Nocardia sp. alder85J]MCX4091996.1 ATP/GTP-binding protein [Nocardia sp. alder85J]